METKIAYPKMLTGLQRSIRRYYKKHPNKAIVFHTYQRTLENIDYCEALLEEVPIEQEEAFALKCAVYLAYCAYQRTQFPDAAQMVKTAQKLLKQINSDQQLTSRVTALLEMNPHIAPELTGQLFADVLDRHLSGTDFIQSEKALRKETLAGEDRKENKNNWWASRLSQLAAHSYRTAYCRAAMEPRFQLNLNLLRQRAQRYEKSTAAHTGDDTVQMKKRRPARGVETMFRITSSNNQRMSDMADKKAHILITVNSIILSAVISLVLRRMDHRNFLLIPSLVLLACCISTMILSILATRPKIPDGTFREQDIAQKKVNLLYFGNFYRMEQNQYARGMLKVMNDSRSLYHMLITDVYAQGVVLGRKYLLLRIAYSVFMYGLILSIASFVCFALMR